MSATIDSALEHNHAKVEKNHDQTSKASRYVPRTAQAVRARPC